MNEKRKLRVLDLFSGIGGFSLGLERAGGFETVAFCEIEPYCRKVLAKHWPNVPCYDDVRTLTADTLQRDGIAVDVICGGFPCQDISVAGRGAGLAGERSGLWREYARLIGELRPRFVIVENVSALLGRGIGDVLRDLAALGYNAEWHSIPAAAVGAPHRRDRLWIVANATQLHSNGGELYGEHATRQVSKFGNGGGSLAVADAGCRRRCGSEGWQVEQPRRTKAIGASEAMANANTGDKHGWSSPVQMGWGRFAGETLNDGYVRGAEWSPEPDVGRVAHGVPSRVDRLGALGNAVVPQIPELIGKSIMQAEGLT